MSEWSFQFPPTESEYAETANSQKRHAREVAEKLVGGHSLSENEAVFAALILRQWANQRPTKKPKTKGRPAKVNPSEVALVVEGMKRKGMSLEAAKDQAATLFEVDVDTIRNALKVKGEDAELHYDFIQGKK